MIQEDGAFDILPDSRPKETKGRVFLKGTSYVPIYCANCGADGGGVPEEHITFAFYLCTLCTEKWGSVAGMQAVPDEIFFERVKQAQMEKYGRLLNSDEIVQALDDVNNPIAVLAREAPKGR